MSERIACLDTGVFIKHLTQEEGHEAATAVIVDVLQADGLLVAPSWAWAEVGTVLRKKVAMRELLPEEADQTWTLFLDLPVAFVDSPTIRERSWRLASEFKLPSLYDAAFLACTELVGDAASIHEFWTADLDLVRRLKPRPHYVRTLWA